MKDFDNNSNGFKNGTKLNGIVHGVSFNNGVEPKFIVTIGVSGCGKSTFSGEYVKNNKNSVVISRDALRMALFGHNESNLMEYYIGDITEKEKMVTQFQDVMIWKAIRDKKTIIMDNTHLREKYINHYKTFGIPIYFVVFNLPDDMSEIYQRDMSRQKAVGKEVIDKQVKDFISITSKTNFFDEISEFNNYLFEISSLAKKQEYDCTKSDCIVFDIDGTLAWHTTRSPFDFSRVGEDTVDRNVQFLLDMINESGYADIIICSGRDESCWNETMDWLEKNGITYSGLYMRKRGDMRKDWIIKAELWSEIQKNYNILGMVDDRQQVVDFARRLGYKVYQCEYGEF